MDNSTFTSKVINWFEKSERDLPWRKTKDPYKIWLSEIILQQTRVSQGMPYYLKFVEAFPVVEDLATAEEEKILRLWQGLGYYSRAKNLHKCAKIIYQDFNSKFPASYQELLQLPGIGPYTAAAIASIAFNLPHAVVDGNVQRVLARFLGIKENIANSKTQKEIQQAADQLIDKNSPAEFNQAIMDLGALICVPVRPQCDQCPVMNSCHAYYHSLQSSLPVKNKKLKRRARYFYYWVFQYMDSIALVKRGESDIWKGLYEFVVTEKEQNTHWEKVFKSDIQKMIGEGFIVNDIYEYKKHVLSHQDIHPTFIVLQINERQFKDLKLNYSYQFYSHQQILQLPKPILIDKFLREKII